MTRKIGRAQRFLRWLFGWPFRQMLDVIGDPMPAEMHAFEAQVEEIHHRSNGKRALLMIHSGRTKPA